MQSGRDRGAGGRVPPVTAPRLRLRDGRHLAAQRSHRLPRGQRPRLPGFKKPSEKACIKLWAKGDLPT
uniref:Uncharacterized protein n=1 Tax=Zea mays TaxID=4577 RepID=A0A804PXV7_MAIZE